MLPRLLVDRLLAPWLRRGRETAFSLPGALPPGAKLLALDSGDLAELVFHAPLLHGLREGVPGLRIDVLLPDAHAPLVAASGLAQTCLTYRQQQLLPLRRGFFSLLRAARDGGYTATLVTSLEPQPALERVALAAGASLRLGPSHPAAWPAVNLEVRRPADDGTYRGRRPAAVLPLLGLRSPSPDWRWPLPEERVRQTRQLVRFNKNRPEDLLIAVDPGVAKSGPPLALPSLQFLVTQLSSIWPCQVVALGTDGGERRRELEAALPSPSPTLPRGDLLETVLLLSQCDLFLGGNTDLFHVAVALDVPAVGLFTAGDGRDWEPRDRPRACVLRVTHGERVDAGALIEAASGIGVRPSRAAALRIASDSETASPEGVA